MNGIKYLLDTNIIIDLLKQNNNLLKVQNIALNTCAVSQISRMELLSFPKLTKQEDSAIRNLMKVMTTFMLTEEIEHTTIMFRHAHGGKLPDAIIIATAIVYDLELLTLDKKMLHAFSSFNRTA